MTTFLCEGRAEQCDEMVRIGAGIPLALAPLLLQTTFAGVKAVNLANMAGPANIWRSVAAEIVVVTTWLMRTVQIAGDDSLVLNPTKALRRGQLTAGGLRYLTLQPGTQQSDWWHYMHQRLFRCGRTLATDGSIADGVTS